MIVALVALKIRADAVDAFADAARTNAAATIFEPGCERFEVYRETDDPTRFALLEVFRDQAAREEHWATDHFLAYREATAGLIESRNVTEYQPLASAPASPSAAAGRGVGAG